MPMKSIPKSMANKEEAIRQIKESAKRTPIHMYEICVLLFLGMRKKNCIYG